MNDNNGRYLGAVFATLFVAAAYAGPVIQDRINEGMDTCPPTYSVGAFYSCFFNTQTMKCVESEIPGTARVVSMKDLGHGYFRVGAILDGPIVYNCRNGGRR